MYDKTVTIVNKLKKADLVGAMVDTWVKTIMHTSEIKKTVAKTVSGTTVSMGETVVVLIPFNQGYLPYSQWKTDTSNGFTMSQGDLIFLDMELTEIPTSSNIATLKTTYDNCEARVLQIADANGMARVQLRIEGV
jgi:hypothetical protein